MISSAYQCGCPENDSSPHKKASSHFQSSSANLKSCTSFTTQGTDSDEDDTNSCGCGSDVDEEKPQEKSQVTSEIASKGLPYKEIEAIINDNRVVVRLQTEKPSKFDPPCECIEPQRIASESANSTYKGGNEVTFQKTKEHCRTINVYPHPDHKGSSDASKGDKSDKKDTSKLGGNVQFPTINTEDNPNIFVLKIKRKCENGDKRHNLDLEFRTPRPWRPENFLRK